MYRSIFYISLFVAVMSLMGIIDSQSTSYMSLLLPSGQSNYINLILALVLLDYSILPQLRKQNFKFIWKPIGVIIAAIACIGIVYPTYFGIIYNDINPVNLGLSLVISSGFLLASYEAKRAAITQKSVINLSYFKPNNIKSKLHIHKLT